MVRPGAVVSRGSLFILSAAVLWGTTGTAQALAPDGTPSSAVGLVRVAIGGVALLLLAAGLGELPRWRSLPIFSSAVAAAAMAAYQPLFFSGVARTGVAVGTVVAIGSAPVLAGVLAYVVRRERVGRGWAIATVLAVSGASLLVSGGESLGLDPLGLLLTLGAGAAYAVYAVAAKQLLDSQPPITAMAVVFAGAAVILSPFVAFADTSWVAEPRGLAVALHLGLIATAAAYLLFARGLSEIPVASTATLTLAEPLTAGLLGLVILDERLSGQAVAGAGLLLAGLAVLAVSPTGSIIRARRAPVRGRPS